MSTKNKSLGRKASKPKMADDQAAGAKPAKEKQKEPE